MKNAAIILIKSYQVICRSFMPPCCRFYPSCSDYAVEALRTAGLFRGLALSARRLINCQPFHPGGCDPVPRR